MKKKLRSNPLRKYNRLFKFLSFDLSFSACVLITVIILIYLVVMAGIFYFLKVKEGWNVF